MGSRQTVHGQTEPGAPRAHRGRPGEDPVRPGQAAARRVLPANRGALRDAEADGVPAEAGLLDADADGYGRTCDTLSGFGEITGSPEVKILSAWNINADDLAPDMDAFTVDGKIVFSDGAQLALADFTAHRKWTGARTFTIMTAQDGIEGCPELSAAGDNWSLAKSQDGKSLLLSYRPNGMIILLR